MQEEKNIPQENEEETMIIGTMGTMSEESATTDLSTEVLDILPSTEAESGGKK